MEAVSVPLDRPIAVAGRLVDRLELREPSVGDFLALGAIVSTASGGGATHRSPPLRAEVTVRGSALRYAQRCMINLAPGELAPALDAMSLADGLRVQRALQALVPAEARDRVMTCADDMVFGWRHMSRVEVDALPVSEFFTTATRLADWAKRQKRKA